MKNVLVFVALLATLFIPKFVQAQNVQLHYDMGSTIYKDGEAPAANPAILTTVEKFSADKHGSTFFFVDMTYRSTGVETAYWEIFRDIRCWDAPVALHLEYNGGLNNKFSFNNRFLVGASYSLNASDFTYGLSVTPSLMWIAKANQPFSAQFTFAWYMHLFKGLFSFTGFADVWGEELFKDQGHAVFVSQPQLWLNLGHIPGLHSDVLKGLSLGGEVEFGYNFPYAHGKFYTIPRLGIKYTL